MAIVETKLSSRPNTSVLFFNQLTNNAVLTGVKTVLGPFTQVGERTEKYYKRSNPSGSYIVEDSYSDDLLTQTNNVIFDSLASWSNSDTTTSIALDVEYFAYAESNGLTHPANQYNLTGIDAPFSCTTTYTYDSGINDSFFSIFISALEVSDKLTSFTNTGSQLIAVHTYTNAADFTASHWRDGSFVKFLNELGVTRTITYAMI
jgi:hypothetical protein